MFKKILAGFVLSTMLLVAACSTTVEQKQYVFCTGYKVALNALAEQKRNDSLSESTIKRVDEIRAVVNPVCGSAGEFSNDSYTAEQFTLIVNNINELIRIRKENSDG